MILKLTRIDNLRATYSNIGNIAAPQRTATSANASTNGKDAMGHDVRFQT
jgi:hypothetical protein